jgi:hypothetical protein
MSDKRCFTVSAPAAVVAAACIDSDICVMEETKK